MNKLIYILLSGFCTVYFNVYSQTYTQKRDWVVGEYEGLRKDSSANGPWTQYTLNIKYFQDFDPYDDTTVVTNFNNMSYNYYVNNDSALTPFPGVVSPNNGGKLFPDSILHFNFVAWGFPMPQGGHMMWFKGKLTQSYVGLKDNLRESLKISLYPNPSNDWIHVSCNSVFQQPLSWNITNLEGMVLKAGTMSNSPVSINISEFTNGVYFLYISSKEAIIRKKIVLQR